MVVARRQDACSTVSEASVAEYFQRDKYAQSPHEAADGGAVATAPPDGRPAMQLKELADQVRKEAGQKLGLFGLSTLKRAMRLAWPPRKARPNRPKPGQTSR